mmetsp:Transcript_7419/g.17911  ORF Transcript_7419/g.17911 Transcript_7419/m.17911 type:complete len:358 (-) Transcript_7419:2152-3225(-)
MQRLSTYTDLIDSSHNQIVVATSGVFSSSSHDDASALSLSPFWRCLYRFRGSCTCAVCAAARTRGRCLCFRAFIFRSSCILFRHLPRLRLTVAPLLDHDLHVRTLYLGLRRPATVSSLRAVRSPVLPLVVDVPPLRRRLYEVLAVLVSRHGQRRADHVPTHCGRPERPVVILPLHKENAVVRHDEVEALGEFRIPLPYRRGVCPQSGPLSVSPGVPDFYELNFFRLRVLQPVLPRRALLVLGRRLCVSRHLPDLAALDLVWLLERNGVAVPHVQDFLRVELARRGRRLVAPLQAAVVALQLEVVAAHGFLHDRAAPLRGRLLRVMTKTDGAAGLVHEVQHLLALPLRVRDGRLRELL